MNILSFPRWLEMIAQDKELSLEQKKAYPITSRWFLGYLKRNKQKASISTSRDFIAQAIEQKSPRPTVEQKSKNILKYTGPFSNDGTIAIWHRPQTQ